LSELYIGAELQFPSHIIHCLHCNDVLILVIGNDVSVLCGSYKLHNCISEKMQICFLFEQVVRIVTHNCG